MFKIFRKFLNNSILKNKVKSSCVNTTVIPKDFNIKFEFDVKLAGIEYCNPNIKKLNIDKDVDLIFEHKNKYDVNAIKVMQNNIKLGYISRNSTLQGLIHRFYNNKSLVVATLQKINPKNIIIDIKLYDSIKTKYISNEFELTNIEKSYKKHWDYVKYNEILDIQHDDNKYIVINRLGEPLGILDKNLTKNFEDYKDVFCHTDYINYKYDDCGNQIISSANLVIMHIE